MDTKTPRRASGTSIPGRCTREKTCKILFQIESI